MAFIGTFSRSLLESATAIYFGGVPVNLMDAQGNVLLGEGLPDAPTITSTIADRIYATNDAPVTVDLRTKFDGATSYTVSPANAAVSITDYTLTISPTAPMSQTTFTVRGINGGGASEPLTFKLTVNAPTPVLEQPFPDQSLLIGGGSVTLPLAEYFSGAATYAVSPANAGVTISNGNLVISRSTARDVIITVTATNATGQDTSDSFALLIGAPVNLAPIASAIPEQGPVANVAFTVDLSGYFEDPDGDPLIFDYTGTLPTGITRTGAVFSGTATVTGQTANGVLRARDPGNLEAEAPVAWLVAVQPAITAEPFTLTAGQQATIRFSTAVDTVTVAQGSTTLTATRVGTTNDWTFTPATTEPVIIGATKAGWKDYSATITPAAALPQLVERDGELVLLNVTTNTPPFTLPTITEPAIYAGAHPVNPADFIGGPVWLVDTDATQAGNTLTLVPGLPIWLEAQEPVSREIQWLRGATLATAQPMPNAIEETYEINTTTDAGLTIWPSEIAVDRNGNERVSVGDGIAVAAAPVGLATGVTEIGTFDGGTAESAASTHTATIPMGPADPGKVLYVWISGSASLSEGKVTAGGVDYPVAVLKIKTITGGRLSLLRIPCPAGGDGVLEVSGSITSHRPRGFVQAAKGLSLVATVDSAFNMTAGTSFASSAGATQVGDTILRGLLTPAFDPNGIFTSGSFVQEVFDAPIRAEGPQLWIGKGVETAASSSRALPITPSVTAEYASIIVVLRNT